MAAANPFAPWVDAFTHLLESGQHLEVQAPSSQTAPNPESPLGLIFSPHPDDECIIGTLPRRLQQELGYRITNVAVTLGSLQARREARWQELQHACAYLGWELILSTPGGLEQINPQTREQHPDAWHTAVDAIAAILQQQRPQVIFIPHARDQHPTHMGTHWLLIDALAQQATDFHCQVVETEFWGALAQPNLLVQCPPAELADLVAALSLHTGEVARNPYHLRLPAWMMDNVRRGAELVGHTGGSAPTIPYASLYRLGHWQGGKGLLNIAQTHWLMDRADLQRLFLAHATEIPTHE